MNGRYLGWCHESVAGPGFVDGFLGLIDSSGAGIVARHVSSNEEWSHDDIQSHFDRLGIEQPMEWLGMMPVGDDRLRQFLEVPVGV